MGGHCHLVEPGPMPSSEVGTAVGAAGLVLFSLLPPADPNVSSSPPAPRGRCSRAEFECQQLHKCIPNWKRCDGRRDCQDGTDERNCRECGAESILAGSISWDAL